MIKKWNITIPELTGWRKRRAYVYIPDYWEENPDQRYPVLYMFDGHNVFFDEDATYGKSWGMLEFLENSQIPLIVAAVECNHSPKNGRLSEYSPYTFDDQRFGHVRGRGRTTMEWMVNRFKPLIDRQYPTLPDREHTFIAGSSMGGLMTLYAVTQYNHIFGRAAALSPSLWVAPGKLDRLFREAAIDPNTVVYMDYGSDELDNHGHMASLFGQASARLMERQVKVNCRIVPGGNHSEASWERQIPIFMETLFYGLDEE